MKLVGSAVLILSVALAQPAFAQASKATRDRKGPEPNPIAQSYAALSVAERVAIETDLIWTGDYNGIADGEIGDRAVSAVKAFQQRNRGKPTGVLNPPERTQLSSAAKSRQDAVGWRIVEDPIAGTRLGVPAKLAPHSVQGRTGSRFTSAHGEIQIETFRIKDIGTTLQSAFEQQRGEAGRQTEYSVLKPDFFVLSGLQGGVKKFYVRGAFKDGEVRGMTILYDLASEASMERVVVAMSNAFAAFPAVRLTGPVVRKMVEYSTGIVIDSGGHILADGGATAGCYAIMVAGLGNADLVAEDKSAGLSLLQVYGARNLRAVALAADPSGTEAVTVAGIADPQAQAGGAAVTTVSARIGSGPGLKYALEPAPAVGFSGAAALDTGGKLVGMVQLASPEIATTDRPGTDPVAVIVPAQTIRAALAREHVAISEAAGTNAKDRTAGIVRVICTRK
jgi:hypothetical protein